MQEKGVLPPSSQVARDSGQVQLIHWSIVREFAMGIRTDFACESVSTAGSAKSSGKGKADPVDSKSQWKS